MRLLRRGWRLTGLLLLLFGGLFTVWLVFPVLTPARRDRTVACWSSWLLRSCGVRLALIPAGGAIPEFDPAPDSSSSLPASDEAKAMPARMLVANHISWVDIFVINAVAPSCFIAKDAIASWPLIGMLVGRVGTMFLGRGQRHAVHRATQSVAEYLRQGRRVAVFPEGTTGAGDRVMPFHANLIEAAVQARVPVQPLALRYRGLLDENVYGEGGAMNFVGDTTFVQSVWHLLDAPGVKADLFVLPPIVPLADGGNRMRHRIAGRAREAIGECLAVPLDDSIPDEVKKLRSGH